MALPIDELTSRWRANPNASVTVALCDALVSATPPAPALVEEVGQVATTRHGSDADVLTAAARMYMSAARLADAQAALVAAGKVAPRDPLVYRWLGEVLLRRGDADRASKVLDRALQFGASDPETRLWAERAKVFRPIQSTAGMRAVAGEVARTAPIGSVRPPMDSMTDSSTTEVRVLKAPPLGGDDDTGSPPRMPVSRLQGAQSPGARGPGGSDAPAALDYGASTGANVALQMSAGPLGDDEPSVTARFPTRGKFDKQAETAEAFRPAPSFAREPPRDPFAGAKSPRAQPAESRSAAPAPSTRSPSPPPPPLPAPAPSRAPGSPAVASRQGLLDGPSRDETPGGALDPHDVLAALELAGIYEPVAAGAALPAWDRADKRKSRGSVTLIVALLLTMGMGSGLFFYIRDRRAKEHAEAEALLGQVETRLHESRPGDLAGAEATLSRAFDLDSRSQRAALLWLRERALLGMLKGGAEIAFEDSITRAKEVGVDEARVAFARVASFLFQGDTVGAAGLLPRWDGPAANDAWYQLLAGATLERAGDARAIERYDAATKLDPDLTVAQVALARAMALDGDPVKAAELARVLKGKLPGRAEPAALVALAWGRDPAHTEAPPPEVAETIARAAELPASLAVVPHALAALRDADRHAYPEAKASIQQGLAAAGGPGVASWLGNIALETGDEQLARKAALEAVSFSAVYPPARVLAARVALLGGRLDEALKATEELAANSPEVAVVRAAAAYERVEPDALARAMEAVAPEARKVSFLSALELAPDVLLGRAAPPIEKLVEMADDDAPWSDLVAMDAALDEGELETADVIAAPWKGTEDHALRALRLARLARYEGRLDAADALITSALANGTVTPRVLAERVLVLVARGKGSEAGPLLAKYPLVLGPMGTWLSAYVAASAGKVDDARGRTASLDPPPPLSALPSRIIAAAALAAMHDRKRAVDLIKPLLAAGIRNPDVAAAAISVGFRKVEQKGKRPTFVGP